MNLTIDPNIPFNSSVNKLNLWPISQSPKLDAYLNLLQISKMAEMECVSSPLPFS